MTKQQEIWIWIGINAVLALALSVLSALPEDPVWTFQLQRAFSTLIVVLNVYRLYAAVDFRLFYGLALVLNHLSLFLTEGFSIFASAIEIIGLSTGG